MLNFNLHTTTEVVFGKDIEEQIGPRLKELGAHRRYRLFARALHWQSERASTLCWQSAAAR